MRLSEVDAIYIGTDSAAKVCLGSVVMWAALTGYDYLTTQIDSGSIMNQGTDPDSLTTGPIPTMEADTGVVSETPISGTSELSTLIMPSVSADTGLAYKLTYDGNGNDGGTAPTDSTWYAHGTDAEVAGTGNLTLTSHAFDGWNTSSNGSGTSYPADASITMNAPITLYAQWVAC